MPISSFHGLQRNSVPAKPWNSTKTSPQKTNARDRLVRKQSFGVPRLLEHEAQNVYYLQADTRDLKSLHSSVVTHTQKNSNMGRKLSLRSRRSRELKRRDTFPKHEAGEIGTRTNDSALKRSKTDPSIGIPKKVPGKFKVTDNKTPKRPTTLCTTTKRDERSPTKFRKRKVSFMYLLLFR